MMDNHTINSLIAEKIMKWKPADYVGIWDDGENYYVTNDLIPRMPHQKFHPSTNIANAWQVVEQMRLLGWGYDIGSSVDSDFHLARFGKGYYDEYEDGYEDDYWGSGEASMAICLAALKAVGVEIPD